MNPSSILPRDHEVHCVYATVWYHQIDLELDLGSLSTADCKLSFFPGLTQTELIKAL